MADLTLYGADYSVYTRIVRLVMEELELEYETIETDIFNPGAWPQIQHVIGSEYSLSIMFHHHDGVSHIAKSK